MKWNPAVVVLVCIFFQSVSAWSEPWMLVKNSEGITVFTKKMDGSELPAFKGTTSVNAPLDLVSHIIHDVERYCMWKGGKCLPAKILKREPNGMMLVYSRTIIPFCDTRDCVMKTRTSVTQGGKMIFVEIKGLSIEESARYVPLSKEMIRIRFLDGSWKLSARSSGGTDVEYVTVMDPAGAIPAWVIERAGKEMPFKTLKGLTKATTMDYFKNSIK